MNIFLSFASESLELIDFLILDIKFNKLMESNFIISTLINFLFLYKNCGTLEPIKTTFLFFKLLIVSFEKIYFSNNLGSYSPED